MFSSLSKYSPKKLLASHISRSLAKFFNVDPNRVESSLIRDAKVVLNDIEIKERRLGGGLRVNGSIKQIEFSWAWDSAALIKDVRLTVRGVSVHVRVIRETRQDAVSSHISAFENPSQEGIGGESAAAPPPDWKAKYMQQIIDHLTLAVTDVSVAVHLNEDSAETSQVVYLQANDMELLTLASENIKGGTRENALMQTISLASIEAWVEQNGALGKCAILEPFGYEASVKRISGRRFLDGVLSGLFVEGKSIGDHSLVSSTIRLHAGIKQIEGLKSLQQVLLLVGQENTNEAVLSITETNNKGTTEREAKSVFVLPFHSIEMVLENETNIRLSRCNVRYSTDGSELSLDCGGIWVDETPISKDSRWFLDLISCELLFSSTSKNDDESQHGAQPLQLNLSLDVFQKIYHGIQAIMPQYNEAKAFAEKAMDQYAQPMSSSQLMSMKSTEPVTIRFTGQNDTWVEVLVDSPKLSQALPASTGAVWFDCNSTEVSSNVGFAIHIPHISTHRERGELHVEHRINATVDSMDTFKVLQTIANDITSVIGSGHSSDGGIPISLAGIDVSFKEPALSAVRLSCISGSGNKWSVDLLQVHDVKNITLDASSLEITSDARTTTVFMQRIKRFAYSGSDYLAAPIDGITFAVQESDVVSVVCKEIAIMYQDQAVAPQSDVVGDPKEQSLAFPMALHLTVDHLRAESITTGNIALDGLNFCVKPSSESLLVDLDLKSIKASVKDTVSLTCGKINSTTEVRTAGGDANSSDILLPGLGHLSLAATSITVRDITNFSTFAGHLSKPQDVVEITYGGSLMIKCKNKVMFCTKSDFPTPQSDDATAKNLPIDVYFEATRLVCMEEFGPGKSGMCFDGLQVHFAPFGNTILGMDAKCDKFQGRGLANVEVKGVKLNLRKHLLAGNDEFLGLKEMRLTTSEVSVLSVPGKLKLARPICNLVVQLNNNAFDMSCALIHVSIQRWEQEICPDEENLAAEDDVIHVPFRIAVDQLITESPTEKVVCDQFSTQYLKASTKMSTLDVAIKSAIGKSGQDVFKLNGIAVSTKWQDTVKHGHEVILPYLGSLFSAEAELEACTEMTTSYFSLIEPIRKSRLLFREGILVFELARLQLDVTNALTGDSHMGEKSKKRDFELVRVPIGLNVTNGVRLKSPTFDVCLKNVGIDYVPSLRKGEVSIHCDGVEDASMSAKNILLHLSLSRHAKGAEGWSNVFPGMECVEKASMSIDEITSICVTEKGARLSQPLWNTTITFQNGSFVSDIEVLQVILNHEQCLALCPEQLSLRIQPDPFDNTIRFIAKSRVINVNGDLSLHAEDISIVTTFVPLTIADKDGLDSKVLAIPLLGYVSSITMDVSTISSFSIANMVQVTHPMTNFTFRFETDTITLSCPGVYLQRTAAKKKSPPSKLQNSGPSFELPCKTSISIGAFQVIEQSRGQAARSEIQCRSLQLAFEPPEASPGQKHEFIGTGIAFQVLSTDFKSTEGSTIVDVPRLSVSGLLQPNDLATVGNLAIGIEKAQIAAEFSSSNWSGDAKETGPPLSIRLPFAKIPKFDLTLRYVGAVVNVNDATIACDEFQGTRNSTSVQIGKHYVDIVKSRIPFLLSKADIANCNLGDSIGMAAGRVLTKTSVLGSTVGIASRDVVGSALNMGKASRGASASDSYRFGDFSRGVASSVQSAAKSGANMRGDDSYQVGDLTMGTTKAVSNYATENRCRLAGASGSALGMVAGAAVLGPVGLVAGSMLGGSAAKSSMAAVTGDPKKDDRHKESQYSKTTTRQQPSGQVPDFFSSYDTHHQVVQGSSKQQPGNPTPARPLQQNRESGHTSQYYPAHRPRNEVSAHSTVQHQANNASSDKQGYQFGDITRGIIAKGKKSDGRGENSGYKFGDFTRGLFK